MRSFDSHCWSLSALTDLIDVFLSYVLTFVSRMYDYMIIILTCMQFSRYNQRLIHLTSRLNYLQAYGLKWTFAHNSQLYSIGSGSVKPMGLSGLEPPTSRLSGVRSNQLSYKPICHLWQWRWRDSNSRPPACKAGALPTELHPHNLAPTCSPTSSPMQYHRPPRS